MRNSEKYQSLVLATASLLTRFGSTSTKMSSTRIAETASVTQPLIYHYFPSKEGGRAKLMQTAYKYLVDNAPEQAQRVRTREDLMEDSLLNVKLPEPESDLMKTIKETAKDLGISLFDQESQNDTP